MDEPSKRLRRRRNRRADFEFFYRSAKSDFHRIASADPCSADFTFLYSFYVVPGGRSGGQDKRTVEVFFGSRPFDSNRDIVIKDGRISRQSSTAVEFGATLQYYRQDDDSVVVYLFPAGTREGQTSGPNIVLDIIKDPRALTGVSKLEMHWRYLIAMMETSSIDGWPSWRDRVRMAWLRITKYEIKHGRADRIRMWIWLGAAVSFVFTVGFAGWIVELVKSIYGQ